MAQKKQRSSSGASHRKDLIDELFNSSIETDPSLQLDSTEQNSDPVPTAPIRTHQQKTEILTAPIPTPTAVKPIETGRTQAAFDPELERLLKTEIAVIRPTGAHEKSGRGPSPSPRSQQPERQTKEPAQQAGIMELLHQSGGLKAAQEQITKLENELARSRAEAESFRSAALAFERRLEEMTDKYHRVKADWDSMQELHQDEKRVLKDLAKSRESELEQTKAKLEQAEDKIRNGLGKVRSRERELEHRIEMIKTESLMLAAAKDKAILDLKKQIDQSAEELTKSKQQAHALAQELREKQDVVKRAVRALRLASTVLETADEQESDQYKKTGS